MSADLSVVICSLNGAAGVHRCLHALAEQSISSRLEIIVVDDGSIDNTAEVAREHGALVVRHAVNRGISAARNSGVRVATAPVIAFLADDCEPSQDWAEKLLAGYDSDVVAVGGQLTVGGGTGALIGFLTRHNPLAPLELDLAKSDKLLYRLGLYVRRQWSSPAEHGRRAVFSFASANMSVLRQVFINVGGFDECFHFGSEDEDLCRRILLSYPDDRLVFVPDAEVVHHFKPSLRDTLRRRFMYGRGSAMLYRKWPNVRPTVFPAPFIFLALLTASVRFPDLLAVTALVPNVFYPQGFRDLVSQHRAQCLLDPYLQLIQESCDDVGFLAGLRRARQFGRGSAAGPLQAAPLTAAPLTAAVLTAAVPYREHERVS
jgi:glycosyltransferase involved in cell wall biosynthesis